ncbi:PaaI family thioesterase [Thalassococcus sp. BH17M4-6]|uniref:PaaI family thioesterase n=1 Tax=Thalassococcus sp. BH17M4-6 TaxID=3413148 RepID=UPI003BD20A2E
MDDFNRIRASFDRQAIMATFGATLAEVTRGAVTVTAPILPLARQQQGFGHAGLTFSLGDSAAGYAALTLLPEDREVVTSEMKIHLLAPAMGERLVAEGRVIRPGKRLIVVSADVYAVAQDTRTHIALLTGTMIPVAA